MSQKKREEKRQEQGSDAQHADPHLMIDCGRPPFRGAAAVPASANSMERFLETGARHLAGVPEPLNLDTAAGADLDGFAELYYDLKRSEGETDADFRQRCRDKERSHFDAQRSAIISALRLLCNAKPPALLEAALREIVTDLTEGAVSAALKQRLSIIAEIAHDQNIKQALEKLG